MRRVRPALDALEQVKSGQNAVLVAFSGGKDSLAVLDLACQVFERVEAFYMYLVPGLRFVEAPMERRCERADVELHRVPHWALPQLLADGWYCPRRRSTEGMRFTKVTDTEALMRQRTGIDWIADGLRAEDSFTRAFRLKQCGAVDRKMGRIHPIWDWKTADVLAYLRQRKIPRPRQVPGQVRTSGVSLKPAALAWIKDTYPDDFKRMLEVFPFADAAVYRHKKGWQEPKSGPKGPPIAELDG